MGPSESESVILDWLCLGLWTAAADLSPFTASVLLCSSQLKDCFTVTLLQLVFSATKHKQAAVRTVFSDANEEVGSTYVRWVFM